jgi:hypothetical protein
VQSLLDAIRALCTWGYWCCFAQVKQTSYRGVNKPLQQQQGEHLGSPISEHTHGRVYDVMSFSSSSTSNLLAPSPESLNHTLTPLKPTFSDYGKLDAGTPWPRTPKQGTFSSDISRTTSAPILMRSSSAPKSRDQRPIFSPRSILRVQKHAQRPKKSRHISFRQPRFCIDINTSINTVKNGRKSPPQTWTSTCELDACMHDSPRKSASGIRRTVHERNKGPAHISRQNHVPSARAAETQAAHAPVPACHKFLGSQTVMSGECKAEGSTAYDMVGTAKMHGSAFDQSRCIFSTENILEGESAFAPHPHPHPHHGMESAQLDACEPKDLEYRFRDMQTPSVIGPNAPSEHSHCEAPRTDGGMSRSKESQIQKQVPRKVPRNYKEFRMQMSEAKKEGCRQVSQVHRDGRLAASQIEVSCSVDGAKREALDINGAKREALDTDGAKREALCTDDLEVHIPAERTYASAYNPKVFMHICMVAHKALTWCMCVHCT